MPKRSNKFQRLITAIETQLAGTDASVEQSYMFPDPVTGASRETDVVIITRVGGHELVAAVECVDHSRPVGVPWIESMNSKYLGTGFKVIAVSNSGFARTASKKAKAFGIETLTLTDAETSEWPVFLRNLLVARFEITKRRDTQCRIAFWTGKDKLIFSDVSHDDLTNSEVFDAGGNRLGTVSDLADQILSFQTVELVLEKLQLDANSFKLEAAGEFDGPRTLRAPDGRSARIKEVHGRADFRVARKDIEFKRQQYTGLPIAHAQGIIGEDEVTLTVGEKDGELSMSLLLHGDSFSRITRVNLGQMNQGEDSNRNE